MRVANIRLHNFKRFTDLTVSAIPESARLVVVVGPNGSGKSSLFDAFMQWYRGKVGFGHSSDQAYFRKSEGDSFDWHSTVEVGLHNAAVPVKGCLYLRTAYRNDPDFSISDINRPNNPSQHIRIERSIDNDQTVADNYRRLVYDTTAAVYDDSNDGRTVKDLREELIGAVRVSMSRVFGDLVLNSIADPLGAGTFTFEKGTAKNYRFKNLSGGEKAAFDLLLDFHIKKRYYADSIYCIDELEAHLHTRVQGKLLKELVRILPPDSQLWVTTHSLGVLRAAQEMVVETPDTVALIDFEGVDPDVSCELVPSSVGRLTWDKLHSIVLDDLSERLAPTCIVVCEGSASGSRRKDFDAEMYNRILATHHPGILFVSGGSADQVSATGASIQRALGAILPSTKIRTLRDRDDLSDVEVDELESTGVIVLGLRNLESYLLAEDVIDALLAREGKESARAEALRLRSDAINASIARGNRPDDFKSAAGDIYVGLKRILGLHRPGNNTDSFLRDTLAPLVAPGMHTYSDLRTSIIDRI